MSTADNGDGCHGGPVRTKNTGAGLTEGSPETASTGAGLAEGSPGTTSTGAWSAEGPPRTASTGAWSAEGLPRTANTETGTAEGLPRTKYTGAGPTEGLPRTASTGAGFAEGSPETANTGAGSAEGLPRTANTGAGPAEGSPETADSRRGRPAGVLRFVLTCWKINLAGAMEFRLSFFLTAGMMFINNFMWLFFWSLFFHRFPAVNGWELSDIMMLWAVTAGGFGWANVLFGNFNRLATIIATGQLDVYLAQPKPVLLNVLASRMSLTAIGDLLFGFAVYGIAGDHSLRGALLFGFGLLLAGAIIMFFTLAANTLAFFIGNAEGLAYQLFNGFLAITTYPTDIFKGAVRIVLFTLVPAGLVSYVPIGLLRDMRPGFVAGATAAAIVLMALAIVLFRSGLRRYGSGNQLALRQ